MTNLKDDLLQVFLEESLPLAEQVSTLAVSLEPMWVSGKHDPRAIARMQAALHTVKGNAGMLGFAPIAKLVHAMEEALSRLDDTKHRTERFAQRWVEVADLLVALVSDPKQRDMKARAELATTRLATFSEALQRGAAGQSMSPSPVRPRSIVPEPESESKATSALTVRVDFEVLDALLDGLSEATSLASNLSASLAAMRATNADALEKLDAQGESLVRELRALRGTVMRARLVPIAPLLTRIAHLVRDLARQRGLRVRWEQRGEETNVDRAVLDRLSEPLLHIVRNAIAHGIESPAERRSAGKSEVATIGVYVRVERDRLILDVRDDGQGIDVIALRERAQERGISVEGLTDEQALRLAFIPRLSTAKVVDDLAGRGVGLDAVERAIRDIDGDIHVSSERGRGTCFELVLPSAISLLSGVVVGVDGEAYVVPSQHVLEAVRVQDGSLYEVNGRTLFAWRELLPVVDARRFLSVKGSARDAAQRCLVLEVGRERCGFLVSHVDAKIEGVVKPLDPDVCPSSLITGVTILPSGRVLPIIDARQAVAASSRLARSQLAGGPP